MVQRSRIQCLVLAIAAVAVSAPRLPGAEGLSQVSVPNNGLHLTVPVTMGSARYSFILDTGSPATLVDDSLRRHLGRSLGQHAAPAGGAGKATVELFAAEEFKVAGLRFSPSVVFSMDLSPMQSVRGSTEFAGVIGMDFLSKYIVQFDFDGQRLVIWPQNTDLELFEGKTLPIMLDGQKSPYVDGRVGEFTVKFMLGSGFNSTGSLHTDVFQQLQKNGHMAYTIESFLVGAGGASFIKKGRLIPGLHIVEFAHPRLVFTQSAKNILGLHYLIRYNMVLDCRRRVVILQPSRRHMSIDHSDMDGMMVNGRRVTSVASGSYAHEVGFQVNDNLHEINSVRTEQMSGQRIHEILKLSRRDVAVTIERNGELKTLVLKRNAR